MASKIIENFMKYKYDPKSNEIPRKLAKYIGAENTNELLEKRNEELFAQEIISILNRINESNFDSFVKMIKKININTQKQLIYIIDIILNKITSETNFINIYVRLINEIKTIKDDKDNTIERVLLFKCQNIFSGIISGKTNKNDAQNILKFISLVMKILDKQHIVNFCLNKLYELIEISDTKQKKTIAITYFSIFLTNSGKYFCGLSKKNADMCKDKLVNLEAMINSDEFQDRELINAKQIIRDLVELKVKENWF
jgi:hypothetical protein